MSKSEESTAGLPTVISSGGCGCWALAPPVSTRISPSSGSGELSPTTPGKSAGGGDPLRRHVSSLLHNEDDALQGTAGCRTWPLSFVPPLQLRLASSWQYCPEALSPASDLGSPLAEARFSMARRAEAWRRAVATDFLNLQTLNSEVRFLTRLHPTQLS